MHNLDREGERLLDDYSRVASRNSVLGKRNDDGNGLFLAHTLSVADTMVALEAACCSSGSFRMVKAEDLLPVEGSANQTSNPFRWHVTIKAHNCAKRVGLVPDAVFALEADNADPIPKRSYYFLEVDRGTMPVKREGMDLSSIYRKVLAYIESRKSGTVEKHYGIPAFRVLFVVHASERMYNMIKICKNANGERDSTMFLFATKAEIYKETNILSLKWHTTSGEMKLLT